MSNRREFSVRFGIKPTPKPLREEAPEGLRYFLLKYLEKKHGEYPAGAAEILEDLLRKPGLKRKFYNPHDPAAWAKLYDYIKSFEWWQIYDLIEAICAKTDSYQRVKFVEEVNEVLTAENTCWRMEYTGEVVYKGSESFEEMVRTASSVLAATSRNTAKDEIHKALEDLSKRPEPDLTGAVQHAMAGLECVVNDVCAATGETLGQVIKRHPDKFPAPLGQAVSMLYGFASDNGRHIMEGGEPNPKEVELIVGIAATVATYLSR